jgi:hypothetical protein
MRAGKNPPSFPPPPTTSLPLPALSITKSGSGSCSEGDISSPSSTFGGGLTRQKFAAPAVAEGTAFDRDARRRPTDLGEDGVSLARRRLGGDGSRVGASKHETGVQLVRKSAVGWMLISRLSVRPVVMAASFPHLTMRLAEAELAAVAPHRMQDHRKFARHRDTARPVPAVALQCCNFIPHAFSVQPAPLVPVANSWSWRYCTTSAARMAASLRSTRCCATARPPKATDGGSLA